MVEGIGEDNDAIRRLTLTQWREGLAEIGAQLAPTTAPSTEHPRPKAEVVRNAETPTWGYCGSAFAPKASVR